ncbi:hypothetical protein L7F22_039510 [Adiantum nelumboides]|nr:hypothetical protein [Adiantum nelumboides]
MPRENADVYVGDGLTKNSALRMNEDWAKRRVELLTRSQKDIVMESCRIRVGLDASESEKVLLVMDWRSNRGDFEVRVGEEDEGLINLVRGDYGMPELRDDLEGVSEECLEFGFLKADLQVECLLRSISYDGSDSRAQLIGKLMEYKEALSQNCLNSFQFLADQCQ